MISFVAKANGRTVNTVERLIDAGKLIEKAYWHGDTPSYGKPYPEGRDAVDVEDIENAPTVDAVLVVRCKDCCYFGFDHFCRRPHKMMEWHENNPNYYCADGKRKVGENNEGRM